MLGGVLGRSQEVSWGHPCCPHWRLAGVPWTCAGREAWAGEGTEPALGGQCQGTGSLCWAVRALLVLLGVALEG